MPSSASSQSPPPRIRIEHEAPTVDSGRHPVKRTLGDVLQVSADVFRDGHEQLRAVARYRSPADRRWREAPLLPVDAHEDGVRWEGEFALAGQLGRWRWQVLAWVDRFASWAEELERKLDAGQQDLSGELSEGVLVLRDAAAQMRGAARRRVLTAADALAAERADPRLALDPDLAAVLAQFPDRSELAKGEELAIQVDPVLARFGAWYELFPRSWGGLPGTIEQVPRLAELGFDVLYLPPIHPIGVRNRKGRNNTLVAGPDDPGSVYAIGSPDGGHTAVDPNIGTLDDVDRLVARLDEHGMKLALDFAIQCSADHPWLSEHPQWFNRRPDGTLKYAENPPKKYQDIYNFDFDCADWRGLWQALLAIVRFWIGHGVRVFRVDNPHTKPLPFWEWLLAEVRRTDPDVIFLAEAFTRRRMMQALAKVGFQQCYTYFTWKNARWELTEYFGELAHSGEQEYFRPNAFVNTPDILTEYLQVGGPNAFPVRLLLAATLSPSYGVYSGFESFEHTPVRQGSEEYLDSEKYELRERALDGPLLELIGQLNRARRDNPALQRLESLRFLETHNEALVAYLKRDGDNVVVTVVNIDFDNPQEGLVELPWDLGLPAEFTVTDLVSVERFDWRTGGNYVRLVPGERAGHVLRVDTSS
ncbi:alpha-1,4-glucan--maltose-1-phosphate maltosyltransferase [Conexibacter sp. CPCC 206217]|uniref:alpha-1,4-glucan--maltose-1-phosphate maltosyltransferase n=1 Tax=Conexibacter sp. CPCC 206217 TaxID=3064574 RepID=UPI0027157C57|nr:alpha-1,4-glucan--maltose-1-phosphate maltosyltransferase [Conexibacter sp. CPCC 206217]MDO8213067.1 alpha-1,4-glucan--maltose-1-phosphate maltosyltransferase [Conexibacter sp. CPCC 206217]